MKTLKRNLILMLFLFVPFIIVGCTKDNELKCDGVNHTVVIDEAVEPTCTETGLTAGSHCLLCGDVIKEQEVVPALGHNYVLDEENSTSEYLTYTCSRCGDSYQVAVGDVDLCEDGHTASDWIVTKEATCTEVGSKHKICTVCGIELEIATIPMTDHNIVIDEAVEATCTETGLTEGSHCSICGEVITAQEVVPALGHDYVLTSTKAATMEEEGYLEYTCSRCGDVYRVTIPVLTEYDSSNPTVIALSDTGSLISNDNGGVVINSSTITITLAGEYSFTGSLTEGNIIVAMGDDDEATLNLDSVSISCSTTDPIYIESGNKVEISAKSGTKNYIYDKRASVTDASGAAIYSEIDLEIKGKGELTIESSYNNGIGTKDDLEIKNLTLKVTAVNNALKGNDSLTIESGTITAISTNGDALKTENSDVSDKGNQRGIITINDGTINLYSACDGIDASYNVVINGGTVNIYTESYSSYSKEVTETSDSVMYLRVSSKISGTYSYSALFTLDDNTTVWKNGTYTLTNNTKYYKFDLPSNARYVKFYCYTSSQTQGQSTTYTFATDQLTVPTAYDTYYASSTNTSGKSMSGSWTNYATNQSGNNPWGGGGMGGGMQDGNQDAATYSCKGIKADNEIIINGGTITVKAHDDAIHANSDTLLDTSSYGSGNVTINGGVLNLYSDDDGLHADGTLTINGGNTVISNSYEALEGNYILIKAGTTQVVASDDGVNAKTSLTISGGLLYLNSNGDGLDSNGTVTMTGGIVLAMGPTNGGNGVIDFDRSFSFSGGLLLAIGCSGMNQKPTATSGNTSSSSTISTSTSSYVNVVSNNEIIATIKVTKSSQNYCVLAYNNTSYPSSKVSVTTSNSNTLVNGLYYVK